MTKFGEQFHYMKTLFLNISGKKKNILVENDKGNNGAFHAHAGTLIEMMSEHVKKFNLLITQKM